jgi:hypothetical protein
MGAPDSTAALETIAGRATAAWRAGREARVKGAGVRRLSILDLHAANGVVTGQRRGA